MSKSSISLKGTLDPAGFACLLQDLAKSVKEGCVCLQRGSEHVTLKPAGGMEFELEATVKKGKQKLELSVKWEESCEAAPFEEIRISSVEPAPAPAEAAPGFTPEPVAGGALAVESGDASEKPAKKPRKK
jgi:amphi-Trp domain-containing protein